MPIQAAIGLERLFRTLSILPTYLIQRFLASGNRQRIAIMLGAGGGRRGGCGGVVRRRGIRPDVAPEGVADGPWPSGWGAGG